MSNVPVGFVVLLTFSRFITTVLIENTECLPLVNSEHHLSVMSLSDQQEENLCDVVPAQPAGGRIVSVSVSSV